MMLTKEECEKALNSLYKVADKLVLDHNIFIGSYDILKKLIQVHFDNPPLKFEELKEGMWVWDNKRKVKLLIAYCYSEDDMGYYNLSNPEDYKYIHIEFEENRFYRKEVENK